MVATPIGNLEDLTFRAVQIFSRADVLACEDTRLTRKIFSRYQVPVPKIFFSYHEYNEEAAGQKILRLLEQGKTVALCTDAGTPTVSDPGYRIVVSAIERGFPVEAIPGPSAVTTALVASGLPTSSFTFKGFPPKKGGPRQKFLEMEKDSPHTLVFFESPKRVAVFLEEAGAVLGNRLACLCLEMTKLHQEIVRGYLKELVEWSTGREIKGEVTLVISGNNPKFEKPGNDCL